MSNSVDKQIIINETFDSSEYSDEEVDILYQEWYDNQMIEMNDLIEETYPSD